LFPQRYLYRLQQRFYAEDILSKLSVCIGAFLVHTARDLVFSRRVGFKRTPRHQGLVEARNDATVRDSEPPAKISALTAPTNINTKREPYSTERTNFISTVSNPSIRHGGGLLLDKFGDSVGGRRNDNQGHRAPRFWRDDPTFLSTTANTSVLLLDVCSPRLPPAIAKLHR
jgi:hypothetical protein